MQHNNDTQFGIVSAFSLHGLLIFLFVLSNLFSTSATHPDGDGKPVTAGFMINMVDIRRMQKSTSESQAAPTPRQPQAVRATQAPILQTSKAPQQTRAPVINPGSLSQEHITKLAVQQTEEKTVSELEAHRQQAKSDSSNELKSNDIAQHEQRLPDQQLVQPEAAQIAQQSMETEVVSEDARQQQIRDTRASDEVSESPVSAPAASGGVPSAQNDLLARYHAAIKATIQSNWRHDDVKPQERCEVEFTQVPGGEVIDLTFTNCPFSPEGRNSAELAVRLTPLPYYGFEAVFESQQKFILCYPNEECGDSDF